MRVVCLSDTHGLHAQVVVPDGDLLVYAGDMCNYGTLAEVVAFGDWLHTLPHRYKVVIAGNHDWPFQRTRREAERALGADIHYLHDSGIECGGLRVYGSPWQPEFCGWAFNLPRDGSALRHVWSRIPEGLDILVTHGPPLAIRDRTLYGELAGDRLLWERIEQVKPRLHVFGHVHGEYGTLAQGGTLFANVATCNDRYQPVQPPMVFAVSRAEISRCGITS